MWRRHRPLLVALGVQLAILALVPARSLVALTTGTEVTLRTMPVDPYDLLSGYYVTLAYEVERPDAPRPDVPDGATVYVVVERDTPAWRFVRYALDRDAAGPDQVVLRGRARWSGVALDNARRLYIPEAQREAVEEALARADRRALVDMRVGADGTIALLRLRADGQTFGED
jgi:uncharacterized membrane-anchored protein